MPPQRQAPTVRLRRLASELREFRARANLTREEVAEATGLNIATLYRLETGKAKPQIRTLRSLLETYGASAQQQEQLLTLLKDAGERSWLQPLSGIPDQYATYIQFEKETRRLLNYESLFIPGLLQTEDYARAVIKGAEPTASRDDVENRVTARMERQALLEGKQPLHLWAIVDEAALRRRVGGQPTMRAQLRKLQEAMDAPNITLQVIPFQAGAHPGMPGSFVIMQFEEGNPDVIYIENIAADLFLENATDISRYSLVFEHLRAIAASPESTRAIVAAALTNATEGGG
ncbi:helix-turn-helix transcriptional regulator [Microbispora amethystogenes]|uniref:helix-turn-helix domain-containing protein n=1 Tax=Microbispora amethystogenes TaxID=1427754 RepID=UPI0033C558BF